ncbi:hypothetical protein BKA62DRAFT_691347 [Auriculariales sp. MPI-PUGE-AT-0066]|nr:hypothetical protein BKA62DRAFT_691347 [Auriculariales sp. MPI-PUGE-AT-0066]
MIRAVALVAGLAVAAQAASEAYTWTNIRQGAGGGFVPGIVFSTKEKGVAYARTDIGGAYRLNSDDTWTSITDWVDNARWNQQGIDALALDPTDANKLYMAAGLYTNSWDPYNGVILISGDRGKTFTSTALPFKVGGNMPGRGMGERLAVDPSLPSVLFYGARSGNGLYKSTDSAKTWTKVSSLADAGTYIPDASDTSGYNSQKVGIAFVTFGPAGTSGTATQRIFVGVASLGVNNVYTSTNGGTSWTAISGFNQSWIPHKAVLSPSENTLYLSFSDGAGPYDGSYGGLYKYNITSATITDITPVTGGDKYFGFGGLAVDLQKPGTIMVAALNCWWPDANIFRSTNGGTTWTRLWDWANGYPNLSRYYKYDNTLAPWTGSGVNVGNDQTAQIGWMIEALAIDPFDSGHWLYGTGKLVAGGHDLTSWDSSHNVTLKVLSDGMNELAVLGLISPPSGPYLAAAVGDESGFTYNSFTRAPTLAEKWTSPAWATTNDIDFSGNKPTNWVRVGTGDSTTGKQVAISSDSGTSWNQHYGAADNVNGGYIAYSADADTVLWMSKYQASFSAVSTLPQYAIIASDKKNNTVFYGASGASFYVSTDGGTTFKVSATLGSSTAPVRIVARWDKAGEVWVSSDKGLWHSTNYGTSFTQITTVTQAWHIGLGAPQTTGGSPSVYVSAIIGGSHGYWRSNNDGTAWVQINDAAHGFGSADQRISGDPRQYGRYTTTTSSSSTSSTTSTSTSTSSTSTTSACTVAKYGQCAGSGYSGCTTCATGSTCTYQNDFYSQCL